MGAVAQIDVHGEKGGSSKPKSPTEASDSLRSTNLAKLLIAVGEGEFDGVPTDYDITWITHRFVMPAATTTSRM